MFLRVLTAQLLILFFA